MACFWTGLQLSCVYAPSGPRGLFASECGSAWHDLHVAHGEARRGPTGSPLDPGEPSARGARRRDATLRKARRDLTQTLEPRLEHQQDTANGRRGQATTPHPRPPSYSGKPPGSVGRETTRPCLRPRVKLASAGGRLAPSGTVACMRVLGRKPGRTPPSRRHSRLGRDIAG